MVEFERVIHGLNRYIESEIYRDMNDWQEVLARIAVSRMIGDTDALKESLMHNGFVRTLNIIDEDNGMVDVEGLIHDLKEQMARKGEIKITFPLLGTFKFNSADIDNLYRCLMS